MMTGFSSSYSSTTALSGQYNRAASVGDGTDPSAAGAAVSSTASGDLALRGEQRVGASSKSSGVNQLSPEQQRILQKMRTRDREVRAHEQAHQSAGGGLAGGATFQYERGPDGQLYAVAGEVKINTSQTKGDPQANLQNAETVLRAALAPADPSGQDRAVAARARAEVMQSKAELDRQDSAGNSTGDKGSTGVDGKDSGEGAVDASGQKGDGIPEQTVPLLGENRQQDGKDKGDGSDKTDSNSSAVLGADSSNSASGAVASGSQSALSSAIDSYEQRKTKQAEADAELKKQQEVEAQRAKDLADYQQQMADLQKRLTEVQQKLANMGVLDPKYLIGSVINAQA